MNPKHSSTLQALALSNIKEGMGRMSQELRGYSKNLPNGEPHSFKIQQRLKLLRVKRLCWLKLLKKKWPIRCRYQSCHICTFDRLRISKLSLKKLKGCLLCWRDSKLSWSRSRNNNRVVSLRCQGLSQLHPG